MIQTRLSCTTTARRRFFRRSIYYGAKQLLVVAREAEKSVFDIYLNFFSLSILMAFTNIWCA
jgi:hypothetical protein